MITALTRTSDDKFNNTFGNFSNIKITLRNGLNSSNASKTNSTNSSSANKTNSTNSSANSANSNEILGYKVDKEGFFTSKFNEKILKI